jgi:hypothetical protein
VSQVYFVFVFVFGLHASLPPPGFQKMRAGAFSVNVKSASPRAIVEACVKAVQPAVSVPIDVAVSESVPSWVRGRGVASLTRPATQSLIACSISRAGAVIFPCILCNICE